MQGCHVPCKGMQSHTYVGKALQCCLTLWMGVPHNAQAMLSNEICCTRLTSSAGACSAYLVSCLTRQPQVESTACSLG